MKICLYSPYVPKHFGGGEKYFFDVARTLAEKHQVVVAVNQTNDLQAKKKAYEEFLNYSLDKVGFIQTPINTRAPFLKKLLWTKRFDLFYYLTDGSLFFSLAKKNILHIQFPLKLDKSALIERVKLSNWQIKNTNSEFTRQVVEKSWPVEIDLVHHPMVDVAKIIKSSQAQVKKQKMILHVGRFFKHLHTKKQDVLVEIFKEMYKQYSKELEGWKLVFIGTVEDSARDKEYVKQIKRAARSLPVEFHHNVSREELINCYHRASIYWHATGFGADQEQHPEKVEHFGISTIEAMAAGCVPIVIGKGGQVESLGEELKANLWQTKEECIERTMAVITNKRLREKHQALARRRARVFDRQVFEKKLWQMVEEDR